jgi:hypothetical protein
MREFGAEAGGRMAGHKWKRLRVGGAFFFLHFNTSSIADWVNFFGTLRPLE